MLDANGSRFALLLGLGDWGQCRLDVAAAPLLDTLWHAAQAGADVTVPLSWEADNAAVALAERVRPFRAGRGDLAPAADARRGAASDFHGNLYTVVDGGRRIEVWSVGDGRASTFWPLPAAADAASAAAASSSMNAVRGSFGPVAPAAPPRPRRWRGLAVTTEQYLVVGIEPEPAGADTPPLPGGLLVFDLAAGGAPLQLAWPLAWPFAPYALAARPCGGLVVLDREHGRVWCLSRQLGMQTLAPSEGDEGASGFVAHPGHASPVVPVAPPPQPQPQPPWFDLAVDASGGDDPIAVLVLPDGSVLVLDARGRDGFARLSRYVRGQAAGQDSTAIAAALIDPADRSSFTLVGFDFALADTFGGLDVSAPAKPPPPRVVVAAAEGNQAYAFALHIEPGPTPTLVLVPGKEVLPLQRYGGRNLIRRGPARLAGDTGVLYHSSVVSADAGAGRWVPLVAQRRPRFEAEAALVTPALDSRERGCTWHRVVIDGCLPPGCEVVVDSRADDDASRLPRLPWRREPTLLRRPGGSELPWLRDAPGAAALQTEQGHGSFELLLQAARGQHLQLRLQLRGNELATPRLVALRAWSPRFSYAQQYLPSIYRRNNTLAEGDDGSDTAADFLERFLANFEGQFTAIEDRITAAGALFDVRSAPGETLDWLAGWLGLVLDPALDDTRRRQLIRHAVPLFQYRGTPRALSLALELALSNCLLDDAVFRLPAPSRQGPGGVRLVERFLARRLPVVLLGETVVDTQPRTVAAQARWSLAEGAAGLHRRWQEALLASGVSATAAAGARFAPVPPATPQPGNATLWADFCQQQLGAVPALAQAQALKDAWQDVVARGADAGLGLPMPAAWPDDGLAQPLPATVARQEAWRAFINGLPGSLQRWLRRWQAFLARRYLRVADYRARTGQAWPGFEWIPAPAVLPEGDQALADWVLFETTVEPIAAHAHSFSVLLPTNGPLADPAALAAATDLAQRVVALEKPAHTRFDIKPYWALFRVGQARLGLDTLLGRGSRDPALAPALLLGRGQVGAGRIAPLSYQPPTPGDRVRLEC